MLGAALMAAAASARAASARADDGRAIVETAGPAVVAIQTGRHLEGTGVVVDAHRGLVVLPCYFFSRARLGAVRSANGGREND
jgi:hypothetical protein